MNCNHKLNSAPRSGLGCSMSAKIKAMTPERRKELFDRIRKKVRKGRRIW